MKKMTSLLLVLVMCLSMCACRGASSAEKGNTTDSNVALPKNVQMYAPGTTMDVDFGTVTIMDAAFCAKAQIYYTKSSSSHKVTINGQTTESYEETIHPGYIKSTDNTIVFALRTVMSNTTGEDLEIQTLSAQVSFVDSNSLHFTKGGNFQISEGSYKILPAGESAEIVLAALLPVEQYMATSECLLQIGSAELGFSYDSINVYNALGFQEGDNITTTIDEVIQSTNASTSYTAEATEETVPEETETEMDMYPGTYTKNGANRAEGRAITVENVSVGFSDTLSPVITSSYSYTSQNDERYEINDTQTFAVINCTITNLTSDDLKLIDTKGNFAVQLVYDNSYNYSTHGQTYCHMVSGTSYGSVRKGSSTTSSGGMAISPLSSREVSIYIPCAKVVAENPGKSLTATFISKYSGSESLTFTFDRMASNTTVAANTSHNSSNSEGITPGYTLYNMLTNNSVDIRTVTLKELDNGNMRYTLEFRATNGMQITVWDLDKENETLRTSRDALTSGKWETFSFDVESEVFHTADNFGVFFVNDQETECYGILLEKTEAMALQTTGNPVGQSKTVSYFTDGNISVHSLIAQLLDNGYVRYTLDYTAPKGRYISFFNPPDGSVFMYVSENPTSGERETYTVDVKKEANNSIDSISIKFFAQDYDTGDYVSFYPMQF